MSNIFATAGSKLYIGTAMSPDYAADLEVADFSGQSGSWVEITPLETIGSVGDSAEAINFDAIGNARRHKLKGTRDAGTMEVTAAINYADAGQIALLAAEKTAFSYAFRLVFPDAPPGGTPSERLFLAKVMTAAEALDTANSVMKLSATLAVDSNIVRVAAAEED